MLKNVNREYIIFNSGKVRNWIPKNRSFFQIEFLLSLISTIKMESYIFGVSLIYFS